MYICLLCYVPLCDQETETLFRSLLWAEMPFLSPNRRQPSTGCSLCHLYVPKPYPTIFEAKKIGIPTVLKISTDFAHPSSISHITQFSPVDVQKIANLDIRSSFGYQPDTLRTSQQPKQRSYGCSLFNFWTPYTAPSDILQTSETDKFRINSQHVKEDINYVICFSIYLAATRIEHQTFTLLREGAAVKSGSSFWQKITVITKKIFF